MEGGSPSCCAGARGSTIRTTPAPPSGTATTRTMSTPTLASVPAVSPPQHPSPSEPLEGIPAGVLEGSRPAPVIGDPRWQGLPRANGRTIRTTPAHGPTAPGLGCLVGFCWALTPTTLPPRHEQPAAPAPAAGPRCAAPAGSARGAPERSSSHNRTQRRSTPAGWSSMPMERGEAIRKRVGAVALRPNQRHSPRTRSGSTALLHRGSASAATASISMANVRGKAGPRRAPPQGGPWPLAPLGPHSTDTVPTPAAASGRGWSG